MADRHQRHRREITTLIIIGLTVVPLARDIGGQSVTVGGGAPPGTASIDALDLVLIDTVHIAPATLTATTHEVATIWAAAGWRVNVAAPDNARPSAPSRRLIPVVIRQIVDLPHGERSRGGRGQRMAWLGLDPEGCPASAIEVSMTRVTTATMSAEYIGHDVRMLPNFVKEALLGRALGRVIAHEIGHWLFGREHAADGLMKPILTPDDLVKIVPPWLPDAWTRKSSQRLSAVSLRCQERPTDRS
jgi:hypothetical protein